MKLFKTFIKNLNSINCKILKNYVAIKTYTLAISIQFYEYIRRIINRVFTNFLNFISFQKDYYKRLVDYYEFSTLIIFVLLIIIDTHSRLCLEILKYFFIYLSDLLSMLEDLELLEDQDSESSKNKKKYKFIKIAFALIFVIVVIMFIINLYS